MRNATCGRQAEAHTEGLLSDTQHGLTQGGQGTEDLIQEALQTQEPNEAAQDLQERGPPQKHRLEATGGTEEEAG